MSVQKAFYNSSIDSHINGSVVLATNGDALSDCYSLSTAMTEDGIGGEYLDQKLSIDYLITSSVSSPMPKQSFSNGYTSNSERDLYEFLREAQLEHYYIALTRHLKVSLFIFYCLSVLYYFL